MTTRTLSRYDINRLTINAWNGAFSADTNHNKYVSRSEANATGNAAFKTLFEAAMKTTGATYAVRVGDIYAEAKKAAAEIRKVADTKGNKDGALQSSERKYLSKEAKALTAYAPAPPKPRQPAIKHR